MLTRDQFRSGVMTRDGYKCVICQKTAVDAHHIIERRLWDDGGYYLDNGAALCSECHIKAENTSISTNEIREAAGIKNVLLPSHLEKGEYDKWGNPCTDKSHMVRFHGELFSDSEKMIREANPQVWFIGFYKYPRTYHLPWSLGASDDDKTLSNTSQFEGKEVIVTVKMDGENTTMYQGYIHARSITSKDHESRHWVKSLHASVAYEIPTDWRVCGENLYASHSISYENLPSYFMVFSIWDENNCCKSWDETVEWCQLLGLETVPVLYRGIWDEETIKSLYQEIYDGNECEGYVVRISGEFRYRDFRKSAAKYVRKGHVQTSTHWMHSQITPNKLK